MERTNNNIHTSRNFFYIFHQPRCINLLYLIIFLIISYIYISLKSPNNPQEHSIIHNAHISRTQSRKPLCRRSIERDSNTRHPGRHKARTPMDHPRVLGGPDVKSLSMIPRVAWWHSSHSFDEPSTIFLGIIQLDASPRKELASNSADRCKRAPTRRSQPLLLLLLFLFLSSSSFSNSFTFELRSTSNRSPLFRGTKGPTPERNSIESLITNRIARDTDSLINPMMNLSTPGNDRHCRFSFSRIELGR